MDRSAASPSESPHVTEAVTAVTAVTGQRGSSGAPLPPPDEEEHDIPVITMTCAGLEMYKVEWLRRVRGISECGNLVISGISFYQIEEHGNMNDRVSHPVVWQLDIARNFRTSAV